MYIAGVGTAAPPHRYDQEQLIAAFLAAWSTQHHNPRRVADLHRAVMVGGRNLALPMESYPSLRFGEANAAFVEVGTDIGAAAVTAALQAAQVDAAEVDAIFFTTVTGVAAPSIDARLMNRLPLRPDLRRTPMFGLGCVAGAAGVARMADYLRGHEDGVAILLSVELCSLTLQRTDLSIANLIASGLFGDGAAAVVGLGARHPAAQGPQVLASRSRFYPNTERVMGWDIGDDGFRIVLSAEVPQVVRRFIADDVDTFLAGEGLTRADISAWICHPGGPKVLEAFDQTLHLPPGALDRTWHSLRAVGNLSSASVLHVLGDTLADPPPKGAYGLLLAMGPGFCAELVLLRW